MLPKSSADPQLARCEPVAAPCGRDPEDRLVPPSPQYIRDKMLDKTIADSFPTSDPPSSLPDPSMDDSFATEEEKQLEQQLCSEQLLDTRAIRERMLDKTLEDTFPTSDPLSSIPNPSAEDSFAEESEPGRAA
jgi:hypothetical protein